MTAEQRDLWDNPMGTDGFEFVEYTAPDPAALGAVFERMGFIAVARHRSKRVTLYRQGDVNFIVNAEPESFAQSFARLHGPSICAIAFRVRDAAAAHRRAIELGAKPVESAHRADGTQHSGDRGDRRQPHLSRRPLWPARHDLRCRFRAAAGCRAEPGRRRARGDRPSDAQRPSRPHGRVGRVLRAALQFPPDPLFRHRGQADRHQAAGR